MTTDILSTIVAQRIKDVQEAKNKVPLDQLKQQLKQSEFSVHQDNHTTRHMLIGFQ